MDSNELLIAGLLATRGSSDLDPLTNSIGAGGVTVDDLRSLSEKWALESWTEYDETSASDVFRSLVGANFATGDQETYHLTGDGHTALRHALTARLGHPGRLSQFTLALAFSHLLDTAQREDCLRGFGRNLTEAIKGNRTKLDGLRGTPFEDVLAVSLAQMEATLAWLKTKIDIT